MRIFCRKHKIVTIPYWQFGKTWKCKCGCIIKREKLDDLRVYEKTRYFLKTGEEIIKLNSNIKYKIVKR